MMKGPVTSLSLLIASVVAQQSAYGQCGGSNWSGATTCMSGYVCAAQNPYYSQCVPGTGATTATTSPTIVKTTITTSTGSSSVDYSHPLELRAGPGSFLGGVSGENGEETKKRSPFERLGEKDLEVEKEDDQVGCALNTTRSTSTTSVGHTSTGNGSFATTDGLLFKIDGETKYFAGTNCYWCGFLTNDNDTDSVFSHMATAGFKIIRVWGFNDVTSKPSSGTVYYQYLSASGSTINTGADGLGRLDVVVAAAQKHGLKLIINFVNNWSDYGGMAAYVTAFGGNTSTWYTNAQAQAQYQTYIKTVVSRYSTSTAVFAWELANEPRCSGCNTSVIYNWAATTSKYIKSLDSNHMVTIGDEGFGPLTGSDSSYPYSTSAGGYVWVDNMNITTLDFATFHLYPDSWGTAYSWGNLWVTTHAAACKAAGKPCLFEEYGGKNNCTNENPWQQNALNSSGIAADLFWQYGDILPSSKSHTSDDGNTIFYGEGNWGCMVINHTAAIKAKNAL